MAESRVLSAGEAIAELAKSPDDVRRERLLAHLYVLSWFRSDEGQRARDYFTPRDETFMMEVMKLWPRRAGRRRFSRTSLLI